jgi:hypothetical protein
MIGVIKNNFNKAFVNEHALDNLIAADKIIAFSRSKEWAVVGRDSVRKQNTYYPEGERRRITCGNDFTMK